MECGEGIKGESCYILPQVNGHFSPVSSLTIIRGVIKFAASREGRSGGAEWKLLTSAVDSILEPRYEIKVNDGRESVDRERGKKYRADRINRGGRTSRQKMEEYAIDNLD